MARKLHECSVCGKSFHARKSRDEHMTLRHPGSYISPAQDDDHKRFLVKTVVEGSATDGD